MKPTLPAISPRDARRQITALRSELAKLAAQHGLVIASAGTHPFSHWMGDAGYRLIRIQHFVSSLHGAERIPCRAMNVGCVLLCSYCP
jgi:hypothetical protein